MSSIPDDAARPEERRPHLSDTDETAAARTARVGDDLSTPIGWVTITEVVDHGHTIELVTVDRRGVGHAWTSGPDDEHLFRRSACPSWCDRAHGRAVTHTADCGSVSLDSVALVVTLTQTGGAQPTVELDVVLDDDTTVITFTPAEARALRNALTEALDRAGTS